VYLVSDDHTIHHQTEVKLQRMFYPLSTNMLVELGCGQLELFSIVAQINWMNLDLLEDVSINNVPLWAILLCFHFKLLLVPLLFAKLSKLTSVYAVRTGPA
jgi:hypothetical protein